VAAPSTASALTAVVTPRRHSSSPCSGLLSEVALCYLGLGVVVWVWRRAQQGPGSASTLYVLVLINIFMSLYGCYGCVVVMVCRRACGAR
jgi:hypothetical protein